MLFLFLFGLFASAGLEHWEHLVEGSLIKRVILFNNLSGHVNLRGIKRKSGSYLFLIEDRGLIFLRLI